MSAFYSTTFDTFFKDSLLVTYFQFYPIFLIGKIGNCENTGYYAFLLVFAMKTFFISLTFVVI